MSKLDYTAFDAELLAQIKSGNHRMMSLEGYKPLLDMAKPFCSAITPAWRVIDRRLQALRKSGKLQFKRSDQVWQVVEL